MGGAPGAGREGIWGWDGRRWTRRASNDGPGPRRHFALAYDSARGALLMHGGFDQVSGSLQPDQHGDFWAWSQAGWRRLGEAGPGPRDHHAMVYDEARGVTLLYGGGRGLPGEQMLLGDTWSWDGESWTLLGTDGPPPRATHRLVYDSSRHRVVLFGGWGEDELLGDTWEWDGQTWERRATEGPAPRFASRMAYDEAREVTVLFGGRAGGIDFGDTWEWDGAAWSLRTTSGPSPRNVHAMAYDRERRRVLLFGGLHDGVRLCDLWEWTGERWRRLGP